jgi:hypothetical protein
VAKVISTQSKQQLPVDLIVQAAAIFYHVTPYRFSHGIKVLIFAITGAVERSGPPRVIDRERCES